MAFWVLMLIFSLFVPMLMIFLGKYFCKNVPKEINNLFGYRTNMSMKNKDTWVFAHKYYGKICRNTGIVLLPLSVILMLLVMGKDNDTVGFTAAAICIVQSLFLLFPVIPTELALRKNFDKNGNKK